MAVAQTRAYQAGVRQPQNEGAYASRHARENQFDLQVFALLDHSFFNLLPVHRERALNRLGNLAGERRNLALFLAFDHDSNERFRTRKAQQDSTR